MARPELSIKHVPDSSLIPSKLTRGRIYFIEDEGIIKINHGHSIATYGDRAGPPGPPGPPGDPGYPIPELQDQIDALTGAVWSMTEMIHRLWLRNNELTSRLAVIEEAMIDDGSIDDPQANYDVLAMLDDVFADNENDTDIEYDEVIEMLDEVFAGNEELNEGDTDSGFTELLDDAFR